MLSELSLIRATQTSPNKRVSGSGFQPSPKSPSATSDTHKPLSEIACRYPNYNLLPVNTFFPE